MSEESNHHHHIDTSLAQEKREPLRKQREQTVGKETPAPTTKVKQEVAAKENLPISSSALHATVESKPKKKKNKKKKSEASLPAPEENKSKNETVSSRTLPADDKAGSSRHSGFFAKRQPPPAPSETNNACLYAVSYDAEGNLHIFVPPGCTQDWDKIKIKVEAELLLLIPYAPESARAQIASVIRNTKIEVDEEKFTEIGEIVRFYNT